MPPESHRQKTMHDNTEHDCNTCPIASSTRRDFVRDAAALGVAGVLATLGISRTAAALPVSMIKSLSRSNETLSYVIPAKDEVQIDTVVTWITTSFSCGGKTTCTRSICHARTRIQLCAGMTQRRNFSARSTSRDTQLWEASYRDVQRAEWIALRFSGRAQMS